MTDCVPSSLFRAFLLGDFAMETADGTPIDVSAFAGRSQSLLLLKLLLCHPQRRLTRDLLTDIIWPGQSTTVMERSLSVAKSLLNTGLETLCGQSLLPRVTGEPPTYQLASHPLLWTDIDACEQSIRHALAIPDAEEALAYWEAAYALLKRGDLLIGDRETYWYQASVVQNRHQKLAKQRVQCALRIADLSLACGNPDRAIAILTSESEANPTHEEIALHLMELLAQRGRHREALQYYTRLEATLLDRNAESNSDIQALAHRLRSKEIAGTHDVTHLPIVAQQKTSSLLALTSANEIGMLDRPANDDILSRLSNIFDEHISVSEQDTRYFDQQTQLYWRVREESILSTGRLYAHVMRHLDDITTFLAHSLSPTTRLRLCEIVCRTALLAGILLYDMGYYEQARQHYRVALQAAAEANNFTLQAVVSGWLSFTWTYTKRFADALVSVQHARYFAQQTADTMIQAWLGAVEAEIQVQLENRDACLQSLSAVELAFGLAPSQDVSYLVEFTPVLLLGYKGVCLQQLYQKQIPETHSFLREARNALEQALASDAPTKRKLYYLSDLAGVYAREGDVEAACLYVTQTMPIIKQIGNSSKTIRQHLIQARTLLQPYQTTSYVQQLDEQMMSMFVPQRREEDESVPFHRSNSNSVWIV